jgi:archaeosortase B (VPXXXP-CTERM-specific)
MAEKKDISEKGNQRREILRFSIVALLLIVGLVLFFSINSIENFLINFTARSTSFLLNLFGVRNSLRGNTILLLYGTKAKFQMIPDCTGIYPFIILVGFILAYSATLKKKLLGIVYAGLLTLIVNYIRLLMLLLVAEKSFKAFQYAHIFIWQTTFIILVIFYFLWWINWSKKEKLDTQQKR